MHDLAPLEDAPSQRFINALRQRTVIIGNSGSGKSTLAARIAAFADCPAINLDNVYWEDQALLRKRVHPVARQMIVAKSLEAKWVIEGVYGWLIDDALPRATALIWLDLPWADCKAGLEARGPSHSPSQAEYESLVSWARQYWDRQTPSSHAGHKKIFDGFTGEKRALCDRKDVARFLDTFVSG